MQNKWAEYSKHWRHSVEALSINVVITFITAGKAQISNNSDNTNNHLNGESKRPQRLRR